MINPPKLTRVHRLDSIALDKTYFTEEGYLVDEPVVTSVGIFDYKNPDGTMRRELRLPEHVFDPASLASYEGKPVIITHEAGRVDKRNVEREIVGTILSEGYKDGEDVRAKIIIHSVNEVERSGLRELSLGYDLVLDETPGEWNGQPYDAIQTEIRINHLALVRDARAGDQARLNLDETDQSLKGVKTMDKKPKGKTMGSEELKRSIASRGAGRQQRRLDEEAATEVTEVTEPAENKDSVLTGEAAAPEVAVTPANNSVDFIKSRRDSRAQSGPPETIEGALDCISQQDEDIGALIDMIEKLQAKSDFDSTTQANAGTDCEDEGEETGGGGGVTLKIQTDSIDSVVRERLKLGRLGDQLNLDGLEEMKPMDAKKAIVRKVNPAMRLDGKSATYINAAFDYAVNQITAAAAKDVNYQRRQMSGRMDGMSSDFMQTGKPGAAAARERMIEKQMNGGKA